VLADEMTSGQTDASYLHLPKDPRLQRLVSTFTADPAAQHDLDHWAKEIGMSKRSLTRNFQVETGMSVGQWVQKFRILTAVEKLAAGYDITSVALACGYSSISAFIRAFHQNIGETPAKYRKVALDEARALSKRATLESDFSAEQKT